MPGGMDLVIILHWQEARKPTSTGGLAGQVLAPSTVLRYGARGEVWDADALDLDGAALLFPGTPDRPATPLDPARPPRRLVIVDGTWPQASRMTRRVPGLVDLPRVSIDRPARDVPRLRKPHAPWARSTLEAIAEACGVMGDPDLESRLLRLHDDFVFATRTQRGIAAGKRLHASDPLPLTGPPLTESS